MGEKTDDAMPAAEAPATSKKKRMIIIAGASGGGVLLLVGLFALLAMSLERVRTPYCARVGLFCRKAPVVVAAPAPVPGACPAARLQGTMKARTASAIASIITADTSGRISLERGGWMASGRSSVSCTGSTFLATFDQMSQRITYQCMGITDGKRYSGTCTISEGGPEDIVGSFGG